jgi:tetratricopeptide (TPR) repeat protein
MTKENFAFLAAGFAFGVLVGVGVFNAFQSSPLQRQQAPAQGGVPGPAGPMAPTQTGSMGGGNVAPMVAEINALKLRLQENPQDLQAAMRLAHLHHDAGMCDQAIIFYEKALQLAPDDSDLLTDEGICFRSVGQFDRALERFSQAQAADPDHWQSLFNTAVVLAFDLGEFDQALATVEPLRKMDPVPPRVNDLHDRIQERKAEAAAARDDP